MFGNLQRQGHMIPARPARIALLVRGHERGTFGDAAFARYVGGLGDRLGGALVTAFVHTWAESEAKASHRPIDRSRVRAVSDRDVREYLDGSVDVAWVGVDDDSRISLPGSTEGRIGGIPARPWKNMWYGKHRACSAIGASGVEFDAVVCVRVDIFSNMESRSYAMINTASMDRAIRAALGCDDPEKIHFVREGTCPGIDNFYVGRPRAVTRLIDRFHYEMDDIRSRYPHVHHQEFLVYYEAAKLARAERASPL